MKRVLEVTDLGDMPVVRPEAGEGVGWLLQKVIVTARHSVSGITCRHYAHRAALAFNAIMTLPQPTAFSAPIHGHDGECPCCRRPFADVG